MREPYTAEAGDPILDRDGNVVAYFAKGATLNGNCIRFMPRLRVSRVRSKVDYLTDDPTRDSVLHYHEVSPAWRNGNFVVWRWSGDGDPKEAFHGLDLFTLKRPGGSLAAAIRLVLDDRYLKSLFAPWEEGHIRAYLAHVEEGENR